MKMNIRLSSIEDGELFKNLLLQPDILQYFPMENLKEIEDSIQIWKIFCNKEASLTAEVAGKSCGMAFLNLQAYQKFAHQCLITIIVDEAYRNQGIGTKLLEELIQTAKKNFQLEILHLEVYENNPAVRLYLRMGFKEFGVQKKFIKEKGEYIGKILMEKNIQ